MNALHSTGTKHKPGVPQRHALRVLLSIRTWTLHVIFLFSSYQLISCPHCSFSWVLMYCYSAFGLNI